MKYVSTRGSAPVLGFADALLAGLAVDGGLYVPEEWPALPPAIEGATERAEEYFDQAVELPQDALGTVATQTRAVGERAAKLVGVELPGKVDEAVLDAEVAVERVAKKAAPAKKAPAKKAAPAAKKAPAVKKAAPAAKKVTQK